MIARIDLLLVHISHLLIVGLLPTLLYNWLPKSCLLSSNIYKHNLIHVESNLTAWLFARLNWCLSCLLYLLSLWRSPPREWVWTPMPRCGRRSLWSRVRCLPTQPTGHLQTSMRVSRADLPQCNQTPSFVWNTNPKTFFDIVGVLTFWVQICMRHPTQDVLVKLSQIACPSIAAYSEASECKPYAAGFTALEECLPTPTAEVAVNGMDPPELGFPSDEPITVTSGQSPNECSLLT